VVSRALTLRKPRPLSEEEAPRKSQAHVRLDGGRPAPQFSESRIAVKLYIFSARRLIIHKYSIAASATANGERKRFGKKGIYNSMRVVHT
jgi:hypothetical protein